MEKKKLKRFGWKSILVLVLAVIFMLAGAAAVYYPMFAKNYAEEKKAEVMTEYYETVCDVGEEELETILESAYEYNEKLYSGEFDLLTPEENGYYDELNLVGNGIMGYIEIPVIGVYLPIYHGVGSEELGIGCGHMPQTSLPVGGESTHAVISAHTGSATAELFTNLEEVEMGDRFYIHMLDITLAYEVDQIQVVMPYDVSAVKIDWGEDKITLVTCTPYGVNTHRLLVTGHRIELEEEVSEGIPGVQYDGEVRSSWNEHYMQGILIGVAIGLPLVVIFIIIALLLKRRNKKKKGSAANEPQEEG